MRPAAALTAFSPEGSAGRAPAPAALVIDRLEVRQGRFSVHVGGVWAAPGRRTGLLGHNGCGKTTVLEACLGLRRSVVCEGSVLGLPLRAVPHEPDLRRRLGCQLQSANFSQYSRVNELLDLHLSMYGHQCAVLHELMQMQELARCRAGMLSRGQRQRLELYLALAHRPDLAFLDEPMTGLDRRFVEALTRYLCGPEMATTAVVLVGHSADELSLVDQVVWLDRGEVIDQGAPATLVEKHLGRQRIRVKATDRVALDQALQRCLTLAGIRHLVREDATTLSAYGAAGIGAQVLACLPGAGPVAMDTGPCGLADLVKVGPSAGVTQQEAA